MSTVWVGRLRHAKAALEQRLWSAFFTYRTRRIRLISVRRTRKEERELLIQAADTVANVAPPIVRERTADIRTLTER